MGNLGQYLKTGFLALALTGCASCANTEPTNTKPKQEMNDQLKVESITDILNNEDVIFGYYDEGFYNNIPHKIYIKLPKDKLRVDIDFDWTKSKIKSCEWHIDAPITTEKFRDGEKVSLTVYRADFKDENCDYLYEEMYIKGVEDKTKKREIHYSYVYDKNRENDVGFQPGWGEIAKSYFRSIWNKYSLNKRFKIWRKKFEEGKSNGTDRKILIEKLMKALDD